MAERGKERGREEGREREREGGRWRERGGDGEGETKREGKGRKNGISNSSVGSTRLECGMSWVRIPPRAVFSVKALLGVYLCLVFVMYIYTCMYQNTCIQHFPT